MTARDDLPRFLAPFLRAFLAALLALALLAAVGASQAATVRYVYDEVGRLVTAIDPEGDTVEYTYDDAGNILSVTRRPTVALAIVAFSPTSGPVGQAVTLVGTGFDPNAAANTVRFNGVAAAVASATATEIVTTVPAGATTGPISVANSRGTATSATPFTVTVAQPPSIASFAPIVSAPGTAVTVSGAHFFGTPVNNQVTVNGFSAAVQSAQADALVVTTPTASGGKVRVTTPAGSATSTADLFIAPAPHAAADIGFTGRVAIGGPSVSMALAATKLGLLLFDGQAGAAGVRATVFDATFAFGASLNVYRPDGTLLTSLTGIGGTGSFVLPVLPATGSYSLLLVPASGRSGNASIALARDVVGTLTPDVPFTFEVAEQGQQGHFSFTAAAGTTPAIFIEGVTLPNGGTFALRNATGGTVVSPQTFGAAGAAYRFPPLSAGTYTIDIAPALGTGRLVLTVRSHVADRDFGALAIDVPATVDFAAANQAGRARFPGIAGETLGVSVAQPTFTGATLRVLRPDGGLYAGTFNIGSTGFGTRLGPLPQSGDYTVELIPTGVLGGTARLTAWRDAVTESLVVDGPPKDFTIAFSGQQLRFTFDGTAGVHTGIRFSNVSLGAMSVLLRRANGALLLNTSIGSSGASLRLGPLPGTETYSVEVIPSGSATGTFTANVWADADAGTVAYGETREVTIPNPNQMARLAFVGASGDQAGFRLTATTPVGIIIRRPDGAIVVNTSSSTAGASMRLGPLPSNGTYTVELTPFSSATGTFTFTPWKDAEAQLVVDGAPVPVQIAFPNQQARLRFDIASEAIAGLRFADLALGSGGGAATILVRRPDGAIIINTSINSSSSSIRMGALTLPGAYTVEVIPFSSATGSFSAKVWIDVVAALAYGESRDIAIVNAGQQAKATFAGTLGDNAGLQIAPLAMGTGATVIVRRPDGQVIVNTSVSAAGGSIRIGTLSQTGTHSVEIIPFSSGTISFRLSLWKDVVLALVPDAPQATVSSIDFGGQQALLRFDAAANANAGVTFSGTPYAATVIVRRPDSQVIVNTSIPAGGASIRIGTLTQAGTHRVEMIPFSNLTGPFTARVWLDVAATMNLGEARDFAIPNGGQQARIAFSGTQGDFVGLALTQLALTGGGATVIVRRPDGQVVVNTSVGPAGGSLRIGQLTHTGTHTVEVIPFSNGSGTFRFALWKDVAATVEYGQPLDVAIPNANQQARLTFTAAAGDNAGVTLASMNLTGGGATVIVRRFDGAVVVNTSLNTSSPSLRIGTISPAGAYTVEVIPFSSGTGTFRFTVWKDVEATLAYGQTAAIAIPNATQQARVSFTAATGDNAGFRIGSMTLAGGGATTIVRRPDGQIIVNTAVNASFGSVRIGQLTQPGTHVVEVIPFSSATGGFDFTLWRDAVDTLVLGQPGLATIAFPLQQAVLQLAAAGGENVNVQVSGSTLPSGGTLLAHDPNGATVLNFGFGGPTVVQPLTLGLAGTYRFVVIPAGSGTGSVTVTVSSR